MTNPYNLNDVDLSSISEDIRFQIIRKLSTAIAKKVFKREEYDSKFIRQVLSDIINEIQNSEFEITFDNKLLSNIENIAKCLGSNILRIRKESIEMNSENYNLYSSYFNQVKDVIDNGGKPEFIKVSNQYVEYETIPLISKLLSFFPEKISSPISSFFDVIEERKEVYRFEEENTIISQSLKNLVYLALGNHKKYRELDLIGLDKTIYTEIAKKIIYEFSNIIEAKKDNYVSKDELIVELENNYPEDGWMKKIKNKNSYKKTYQITNF